MLDSQPLEGGASRGAGDAGAARTGAGAGAGAGLIGAAYAIGAGLGGTGCVAAGVGSLTGSATGVVRGELMTTGAVTEMGATGAAESRHAPGAGRGSALAATTARLVVS